MSTIGGLKYQVDLNQLRSLTNAQERIEKAVDNAPTQGPSFSDRLSQGLKDVASAQNTAAAMTTAYETGAEQDLTKVMVSQQVSSLGFQLTLNLRNKALSAYKDIMNMPV